MTTTLSPMTPRSTKMRNRKKTWRVALVVVVCVQMVMASTPAFAELLAYEPFENYTLGNIVGQANMGTGFDNGKNWRQNNGSNEIAAGGLTYSAGGVDLQVSGNQHVSASITPMGMASMRAISPREKSPGSAR